MNILFVEVQLIYNIIFTSDYSINIFIDYTPFNIITKWMPHFPVLYNIALLFIYFIHSSLYLLILCHQLVAPPSLSLMVTTILSSISVNLFCFVIYIHLTFQIPHTSDNIEYCLSLTSFTKHNVFQVHESTLLQMAKLHSF